MEIKSFFRSSGFAFTAIVFLIVGFLVSKTISNIGFLFAGIYVITNFERAKIWLKNPWLVTFALLSVWVILVDVYWNGMGFLHGRGLMKAVIYLIPVFVLTYSPDEKWISRINYLVIAAMLWSSLFSIWQYISQYDDINVLYKTAKVIRTLAYKDHIRIGWMTVLSMLLAGYEFYRSNQKKIKGLLVLYIIFQFAFLHLLGSKMGLVTLYLSVFILITAAVINYDRRWIVLFPFILIFPFIVYKTIPSFTERVNYTIYDFKHYIRGEYREGLSDATRFYSIKAGIEIIKENPKTGVGFILLHDKSNSWYQMHLPDLIPKDRFIPISQVIVYWAGGGIIGLMIILFHILIPFFIKKLRSSMMFMAFYIPLALSLLVETHLENQLPLSMYGLMVGWFYYLTIIKKI